MSIADLRARARAALHTRMSDVALYIAPGQLGHTVCTIRVSDQTKKVGDLVGFDFASAERVESVPEIVALLSEVDPVRGGIFSLAPGVAFRVEAPMPPHGITVNCQVTRVEDAAVLNGLPVPVA